MQEIKDKKNPKNNLEGKNNIMTDNELVTTDSTESKQNIIIKTPSLNNENNDSNKTEQENSKKLKKKKVNFIDQIQSKKNIAQIIFINDKVSLNEDKIDSNKYLEQIRKQNTNISENTIKNKNNVETYRIKRPKKAKSLFSKRKIETVNEQCTCAIF